MKTYISGAPHGFNLYENEAGMDNYFLSFYVSYPKGRRLMINRRKNGDTIYSYIQYGINDEVGRGRNSFFSMSLLFENGKYTADFKILLDFFDKLFEKIISDEIILTKDKKYKIAKFSDARDYVENIKSVITEFVSQSEIKVESYDDTFLRPSSYEEVADFEDNKVSDNTLLQVLKNYAWVSASNIDNTPNTDPIPNPNPNPIIVLNKGELESKSNDIRNLLLDIYENPDKYSYNEKIVIRDTIKETIGNIEAYLKTIISNEEEYKVFDDIYKTYNKQLNSINKIIGGPNPETYKTCKHCNANKYISDFSSPEVEICKECEAKTKTKKCQKCGEKKGADEFDANNPFVCKECSSGGKPPTEPDPFIQKYKFHIVIAFAFSLIVFVALILTNTISFGSDDKKQDVVQKPVFERSELNKKLEELENASKEPNSIKDIETEAENVYSYIEKEYLNDDDKKQIKVRLNNTLKNVFDKLQGNFDFSKLDKNSPIIKLIESFGSNYDWKNIANDYKKIQDLSTSKETRDSILASYKDIKAFDKFYNETINNQGNGTKNQNTGSHPIAIDKSKISNESDTSTEKNKKIVETKKETPVYTLTYVKKNGESETIKLSPSKNGIGYDALIDTKFTVTCKNGVIHSIGKEKYGKNTYTAKVAEGKQTVSLTGESNMVLTITGKTRRV